MVFSWLRRRRRRKILAEPFPAAWDEHLRALPFYGTLSSDEQARLREITQVMVSEKNWEGCGGLVMTDEIRVTVSGQAALLLLNIEHEYYRRARSVVVHPSTILASHRQMMGTHGLLQSGKIPVLGLAFYRGPVVLSWDAVRHGGMNPNDGRNLVIHEFAHKLDMLSGCANGTPPLHQDEHYGEWIRVMTKEFRILNLKADKGQRSLLDKYGATNPAEFFAVATECFFEKPRTMARRCPDLYDVLKKYYCQDPAARDPTSA